MAGASVLFVLVALAVQDAQHHVLVPMFSLSCHDI